jgi:transcriptional regulator with XRE-family HTH domain
METPLQRERRLRGWSQAEVADRLGNVVGPERGHPSLGIDANAVSRHERGLIAFPRAPYPELYAALYGTTIEALWPTAKIDAMERRRFFQAMAVTAGAALLPGADPSAEAVTAVTGGFRRLEATTPAGELRRPVDAHLRFLDGRLDRGGRQLAAAASEAAGLAAWLAVDQADDGAALQHYRRAIGYAERSGSEVLAAYMLGSMALWAAEAGRGRAARRLIGQAQQRIPTTAAPTVQGWSAAIEGVAHASAGDADAALAALKRAEVAVALGHEPRWPWLYPFDAARLAGYVGACATRLRLPRTALPALAEALDGLGADRTKQRALILADLAVNHRALGDADQARELAAEAQAIGAERASPKVLGRVRLAA